MEDRQLMESLPKRQESGDLDFKSDQYNFANNYGKSKFIKDIIAMANTPGSGPAYILAEVQEQSGRVRGISGVTDRPDEAMSEGHRVRRRDPTPRLTQRQIEHDGVDPGLIDLPCNQPVPIMPRTGSVCLRCMRWNREVEALAGPWTSHPAGPEGRNRDNTYHRGRVVHTPHANGTAPQPCAPGLIRPDLPCGIRREAR